MEVSKQLAQVQTRIKQTCEKAGRNPNEITLIAVTKYVSTARAKEALTAGIHDLAESYDKGFIEKHAILGSQAIWHFIGSLQSKKVKHVINEIDYLHSLDREKLAQEIQKHAKQPIKCLVQVNISQEASKSGIDEKNLLSFVQLLQKYDTIRVVGLMTMAPLTDDTSIIRACFSKLKELQQQIQSLRLPYASCEHLSMGMSNDFEIAIEEGATMIRIGTSLVGE